MEAFKRVEAARAKGRPTGYDFISNILTGFLQLHGDRRFGDDQAVVAGIGWLNDLAVTAIAIDRGKDTKEKVARNFGSAHPEGYRKALRQMKLAEKFGRPIVCFVDTAGAYCGIGAEERGQAQAIAENLMEMMALKVPVITILTGEGGSRRDVDAGECGLLGHLTGGLRKHFVEGCFPHQSGSGVSEADRTGAAGAGCGRTGAQRTKRPTEGL